jgi:hypothetical protein
MNTIGGKMVEKMISELNTEVKPALNLTLEFGDKLIDIIEEYKAGTEEALDGDEVDILVEHIRNQINLIEGNLTLSEYNELE